MWYAEVDGWQWNGKMDDHSEACENVLDVWIMSKIHTLINDVETATKKYDLQMATRAMLPFVDELSNWYVRRSRKRFWKSDDDQDKQKAYKTLHYVLVQLAHVMAPFTPFMAEELYRNLTGKRSVHLCDWPKVGHVNERVVAEMDAVRRAVNEGLALRSRHGVKIRQPLKSISVSGAPDLGPEKEEYLQIIEEEINVKSVVWNTEGEVNHELDTTMTDELKAEGIARELVRAVQQARKDAGLQVDDRISLGIVVEDSLVASAAKEWAEYIAAQTLALDFSTQDIASEGTFYVEKKLEGTNVRISLAKSSEK
jgi:isoleucyl-tRNA synthetase